MPEEHIQRLLKDKEFLVRINLAEALFTIPTAKPAHLYQLLTDRNQLVRANAAYSLSRFKDKNTVDLLIKRLSKEKRVNPKASIGSTLYTFTGDLKYLQVIVDQLEKPTDERLCWVVNLIPELINPQNAPLFLIH